LTNERSFSSIAKKIQFFSVAFAVANFL